MDFEGIGINVVMCDPTDLIWRKGTSFEAMTGRTAPSSDGLLAEVFWGFLCTAPRIISLSPLSLATDVTDATFGACGLWLGTRTGAGGTATVTESFFGRSVWLHGQLGEVRNTIRNSYLRETTPILILILM